jgi:hypothetical protein
VVQKQVPLDTVTRARSAQRSLVFSLCNLCNRADALSRVSDSTAPGPRPGCLDEAGDWDRGACCVAAQCAMDPRNQRAAYGTAAASAGQTALDQADLESQQFAGIRIQRVPERDTRRQIPKNQSFSRPRAYIHRQHGRERRNLLLCDSGSRRSRPRERQFTRNVCSRSLELARASSGKRNFWDYCGRWKRPMYAALPRMCP